MGLVLGLTGAGGSILEVPALVLGLGWSMTQATKCPCLQPPTGEWCYSNLHCIENPSATDCPCSSKRNPGRPGR